MTNERIKELVLLEDLERIENAYKIDFGCAPINLSHWDMSRCFKEKIPFIIDNNEQISPVDYIFSYTLAENSATLSALGFNGKEFGCLITHSGSSAIVAVVNWLRVQNKRNILIVGPRYFTVPHSLEAMGISHRTVSCPRILGRYHLPDNLEEIVKDFDAVWITNPIYCTSTDYLEEDINRISQMSMNDYTIIIDECLSEPGRRISSKISYGKNVASIHAPHKMISVNGIKFSAIIFSKEHQWSFDAWADVWSGCIPLSSVLGVRHFISDRFNDHYQNFKRECAHLQEIVRSIVLPFKSIEIDQTADGYMISIYAPKLSAALGLDFDFLTRAARESGAVFISGARNEIDQNVGLSFRINLVAFDVAAQGALSRLCYFLERESGFASSL